MITGDIIYAILNVHLPNPPHTADNPLITMNTTTYKSLIEANEALRDIRYQNLPLRSHVVSFMDPRSKS